MYPPMPDLCNPWDITWDEALSLCVGDTSALEDLSVEARDSFLFGAQRWLWWRTGRRFGECETTVTTEHLRCRIHATSCCPCGRIDLSTYGPVRAVSNVALAGVPLVADTDFVVVGSQLQRLPRGSTWPRRSTLEVTWSYGEDPPADLVEAAGILAVNDALQCAGRDCELPARTKSISAEGMSIQVDNPDTWTKEGRTGIPRVDRVLARWPLPQALAPAGGFDPATAGAWADRVSW